MRRIAIVTVARSDYGIYRSVLERLAADPGVSLSLLVGGMHLSPEFGYTVAQIEADGYPISDRVDMLLSSDAPAAIAKSMGLGVLGYAQALARERPDLLVVLGDRFEMHAAALAALPFKIPVAHLHGGEVTAGAIDDALRHSLTKLSHLHFVATEEYARRVRQLGEEPWRVTVSGAPGLDPVRTLALLSPAGLAARFGLRLETPPLLVTFHPVTLEYEEGEAQLGELLAALEEVDLPVVFTLPNADTGGRGLAAQIRAFCDRYPRAQRVDNLGTQAYFSLMALAAAMVGNSSSGLIEAPSFELPVVNVGSRQDGRIRGANVIQAECRRAPIAAALREATSPAFRESLRGMTNPYGSGDAAERIVARLKSVPLDQQLLVKRFHDLPEADPAGCGSEARPSCPTTLNSASSLAAADTPAC